MGEAIVEYMAPIGGYDLSHFRQAGEGGCILNSIPVNLGREAIVITTLAFRSGLCANSPGRHSLGQPELSFWREHNTLHGEQG